MILSSLSVEVCVLKVSNLPKSLNWQSADNFEGLAYMMVAAAAAVVMMMMMIMKRRGRKVVFVVVVIIII
jgi:hypothetical protein